MIVFYVGVDKCGSTSIFNILTKQHWIKDLKGKDTNLLIDENFKNHQLSGNINKIKEFGQNSIFVEYSHDYWLHTNVAKTIKKNFPESYVICSIRNPILRSVSALKHYKKIGTKGSDEDIIKNFPDIIDNSFYKKLKDFLLISGKLDDNKFYIINIDSEISLIDQLNLCMSKFGLNQVVNEVNYNRFAAKDSKYPFLTNLIKKSSIYIKYIIPSSLYQYFKDKFYSQSFLFKKFDKDFDYYWKQKISKIYGSEMLSEYNSILKIKE